MQNELSVVVNALPELVWTALPDGSVDFLNQHWCDYTGLRTEDSHGHGWQKAIQPEDLPHLLEQWGSADATGEPREAEARMRRFDSENRWFLFRTSPMTAATGVVVKWQSDAKDERRLCCRPGENGSETRPHAGKESVARSREV